MKGRLTKTVRNEILARTYTWAMLLVLGMLQLPAQSLIDPVSGSMTIFTPINSDYGPRNVTQGSNPHVGIDYHLPQGGKAYAVEGGTIQTICLTCNTPYIRVGNWRYIHMLTSSTSNQTWHPIKTKINSDSVVVIFQRQLTGGILQTKKALVQAGYGGVQLMDPITTNTVTTQSTVNSGDWVFVSDNLNHLHIDYSPTGKDGWENPLRFIRHLDQVSPTSSLSVQRIIYNNALTVYDSVVYGHPLILCSENNVSVEKDLEKAEVFTTPEGRPKEMIRKWEYSHHKLQGIPIRVKNSLAFIQSAPDSGIYPAPGVVSIDYLKHYWYSRAKVDGGPAFCVLEARHPDGYHVLEHIAADITNHSNTQTRKVILDNFKPFVKAVSISTTKLLYAATVFWDGNAQQLGWSVQSAGHFATGLENAYLHVQTSEPMQYLKVNLVNGSVQSWSYMQAQNSERTEWATTIPYYDLQAAIQAGAIGFQPLEFNGLDRAGNSLFVPNFPAATPSYLIPRRNNDGSWTVPGSKGSDTNHGFYLNEGPSGNILDAEFVASSTMGISPLHVDFVDASSGNPTQFQWNFGNGAASTTKYPATVTYINEGSSPVTYSVSLKVKDASGNENTEYKVNHITVFPDGASFYPEASFTFVQSNLGAPSHVSFVNQSKGNQLSYYWDFDDGTTSTAQSPLHTFFAPGYYDVKLVVTDVDGYTDSEERTVYVYSAMTGNVSVFFTVDLPAKAGDFTKFNDKSSGVPLFARRLWDFGDGTLVEVLGVPMHLYYQPGSYQVRLEVRDYLDNIIGAYCTMVDIIPNSLTNLNTEYNQVKAPDGATGDAFGRAVAINGDWVFLGAPFDDDMGNGSGSVYVFRLEADSSYGFFQKILPTSGKAFDYFGRSVASDGQNLIVGAPQNANYGRGKIWFFEYNGNKWVEKQVINCPASNRYFFGWSIDLKGDLAIVGAPGEPAKTAGMAVIYRKGIKGWTQEAQLYANSTGIDHFGECVAIDGEHAMLSMRPFSGDKIRFYHFKSQSWTLLKELNTIDVESIALECPTAVVGDTWNDRVILYRFDGSNWWFDVTITPEDGASAKDQFGTDVAISGKYLLVGAPGDITVGKETGSAYLFRKDYYGTWRQHLKLMPTDGDDYERFGYQVALSHSHALAGAYGWKASRGSAYTFPFITDPCDRKTHLCSDYILAGESRSGEFGSLEFGGHGCDVVFEDGSHGTYLSKSSILKEGFTAASGSEVTITAVNCYYSGSKSGKDCICAGLSTPPIFDKETESSILLIFPNPTLDQVEISWNENVVGADLNVFHLDGELILHRWVFGNRERISTGSWAPGVYLVELRTGTDVLRGRLVKGL